MSDEPARGICHLNSALQERDTIRLHWVFDNDGRFHASGTRIGDWITPNGVVAQVMPRLNFRGSLVFCVDVRV